MTMRDIAQAVVVACDDYLRNDLSELDFARIQWANDAALRALGKPYPDLVVPVGDIITSMLTLEDGAVSEDEFREEIVAAAAKVRAWLDAPDVSGEPMPEESSPR